MWNEFKAFVMKGNVLDLAVAVILGAAFTKIVTAVNAGVLMPLVSAVIGKADFTNLTLSIGDAELLYGAVIQTTIDFLLTAIVLFVIIKSYNTRFRKKKEEAPAPPPGPTETELLAEIRDLLKAR